MIRTLDASKFNLIANHPDVRPHLGGSEVINQEQISNINNYCLMTDDETGAYYLQNFGEGRYVVHTVALKSARGKPMAELMKEGFKYMFTSTDCIEIQTFVADGERQAERWTEYAKFRKTFHRDNAIEINGIIVGMQYYTMTFDEWISNSDICKEKGEEFHKFLEEEIGHPNHPDDEIHDKYVGATILCCENGNAPKGILQYNKWAVPTGYQASFIASITPLVVNIGNALLQQTNGSIKLLKHFNSGELSCQHQQQQPQ